VSNRNLLVTALVGALLPPDAPRATCCAAGWDTWSGIGHVLDAMTAAGYHAELRQSVFGWRATRSLSLLVPVACYMAATASLGNFSRSCALTTRHCAIAAA